MKPLSGTFDNAKELSSAGDCVIDSTAIDQIMDLSGDDVGFLGDMIDLFLSDSAAQYDSIVSLLQREDHATAAKVAHSLKSSSRTLGAVQLGNTCQHIETLGGTTDAVSVARLVKLLRTDYERACAALRSIRSRGMTGDKAVAP